MKVIDVYMLNISFYLSCVKYYMLLIYDVVIIAINV